MIKHHDLQEVRFEGDTLILRVDGTERCFPLAEVSPRLYAASSVEREKFEISPSGYGIHWPLVDEDLSIDGILGIRHAPSFSKEDAA
ncbi:MAG: hypothetical protein FD174_1060 [Geobacteraceae bacterium]|nr:MAG: hypothetical protein FD174_1060 [Geobacteraceae bacterium]